MVAFQCNSFTGSQTLSSGDRPRDTDDILANQGCIGMHLFLAISQTHSHLCYSASIIDITEFESPAYCFIFISDTSGTPSLTWRSFHLWKRLSRREKRPCLRTSSGCIPRQCRSIETVIAAIKREEKWVGYWEQEREEDSLDLFLDQTIPEVNQTLIRRLPFQQFIREIAWLQGMLLICSLVIFHSHLSRRTSASNRPPSWHCRKLQRLASSPSSKIPILPPFTPSESRSGLITWV
jgi:hypothetical protein